MSQLQVMKQPRQLADVIDETLPVSKKIRC